MSLLGPVEVILNSIHPGVVCIMNIKLSSLPSLFVNMQLIEQFSTRIYCTSVIKPLLFFRKSLKC